LDSTLPVANSEKPSRKLHGVFQKIPDSGVWWIRYADAAGRIRREKAGIKSAAIKLYQKRKTEALQRKKLPETIRRRETLLAELLADAAEHIEHQYRGQRLGADGRDYRHAALKEALGNRPAGSVTAQEIERALSRLADERKWKSASFNRHKAFLSLAYRLGVGGGKVESSPIRLVHRRREDNGRIRWLSANEETKLRAVIQTDYLGEMPRLRCRVAHRDAPQRAIRVDVGLCRFRAPPDHHSAKQARRNSLYRAGRYRHQCFACPALSRQWERAGYGIGRVGPRVLGRALPQKSA
jgi:hypothetical protein